ncbi:hypothetical protein B7494_g1976 [Chlorociboria aeruginascens]|nr:hypothetical protein B7494_g1976 [Chlorociboria aeruginascens]
MVRPAVNARKKRVFDSVFGKTASISQPTPVVTPTIEPTAPGQTFGGLSSFARGRLQEFSDVRASQSQRGIAQDETDQVRDQIRWDRSWHSVTLALSLPEIPVDADVFALLKQFLGPLDEKAVQDVLNPQSRLPSASYTEDIILWHTEQVRHHFLHHIVPVLVHVWDGQEPQKLLYRNVKVLDAAHRRYLHSLSMITRFGPSHSSHQIIDRFERDLSAIINNSITNQMIDSLKTVLEHLVSIILGIPSEGHEDPLVVSANDYSDRIRGELLDLVKSLMRVGLAEERFEVVFAEVMNDSMEKYVHHWCKGVWSDEGATHGISKNWAEDKEGSIASILPRTVHHSSPSRCVLNLCGWVENHYARLAVEVFSIVDEVQVSYVDMEKWKEISIGRLAGLRTDELFDIVTSWPHTNEALHDLRTAITTPQRRLKLTEIFSSTLNQRLLHPGASTLQILRTYISMIWSFHALDHSKVLLDRVAYPLQMYLCSREDTVRIVIIGLLSDINSSQEGSTASPRGERLSELALMLNDNSEPIGGKVKDDELDWHDMDWVPDPVDAGPGYKRSKNADIIGTLIGALGSQDVFIKEFQSILGENLLKQEGNFEKEIKVLELLKSRFGEAPLQGCEVMLKDIQDSVRVNRAIRKTQNLYLNEEEHSAADSNSNTHTPRNTADNHSENQTKTSIHAKILSRLFWPQLQDQTYRVPDSIAKLQGRYERGFESLKNKRKLTWLHALGQATVELEFEDRVIIEEVHTWQASVIWAFQSDESNNAVSQRDVTGLVEQLEMDEALVRSALKFWVSKLVLREVNKDVFTVLDTLNQEDRARSNAQAAATAAATADEGVDETALLPNDGISTESMQMYWQYIQGMLKNSSSQMPLLNIARMLKMLVVDGFPYSNEELQDFLGQKVADGDLELVGGKYKLKK